MDIFLLALTVLMLMVIYFDLTSYLIPNWLNGLVLGLFLTLLALHPEQIDWQSSLLAFGIVFAVGFAMFAFRMMGGGDIKLLIALAPFMGFSQLLLDYALLFTLAGGALSLALYVARKIAPQIVKDTTISRFRIIQNGAPVPYGLAIAGAFLYMLLAGKINGINGLF